MTQYLIALAWLLLYSVKGDYMVNNVTMPTYILNTSLPASEYLKEMCADQKEAALNAFSTMIGMIPKSLQPFFEEVAMHYYNTGIQEPYKSEIDYFSECAGLTIKQLMTVNIVYDLTAFCTSIIVKTSDGQVVHGRNQDYPTVLRPDTVIMRFVDADNNTLYEATNFAGYVGIPTGFVPNGFTITIDARDTLEYEKPFYENIIDTIKDYFPSGWLVRECLMYDKNFDECVKRLSSTKVMAPMYYIIAGVDNGAIITRNQTNVNGPNDNDQDNIWYLNESTGKQPNHGWYILETNYDYWKTLTDGRREAAIKMLNSVGQNNINYDSLFNILSTPPVLAPDTLYTVIMNPGKDYFSSLLRYNTTK